MISISGCLKSTFLSIIWVKLITPLTLVWDGPKLMMSGDQCEKSVHEELKTTIMERYGKRLSIARNE